MKFAFVKSPQRIVGNIFAFIRFINIQIFIIFAFRNFLWSVVTFIRIKNLAFPIEIFENLFMFEWILMRINDSQLCITEITIENNASLHIVDSFEKSWNLDEKMASEDDG